MHYDVVDVVASRRPVNGGWLGALHYLGVCVCLRPPAMCVCAVVSELVGMLCCVGVVVVVGCCCRGGAPPAGWVGGWVGGSDC